MYLRHYSPLTSVRIVSSLGPNDAGISFAEPLNPDQIQLPLDPQAYAQSLYASLHTLDQLGHPEILIQMPPDDPEWETVWDRIEKSAGP